jgi:hypothetical protein
VPLCLRVKDTPLASGSQAFDPTYGCPNRC